MVIVANKSCVLMRSGLLVAWQKILGDGLMIGTVWKLHRVNASSGRSVALMIQTRRAGGGGGGARSLAGKGVAFQKAEKRMALCVLGVGLVGSRWSVTKRDGEAAQPQFPQSTVQGTAASHSSGQWISAQIEKPAAPLSSIREDRRLLPELER